jgi:uncharacterized membrane protein
MFSDAVFAINITVLGLDLRLPAVPAGQLAADLLRGWPVYLAYLTSFLVLAVAWVTHRSIFARVRRISLGATWANIGLLLTIGLVPFPTRLLAEAIGRRDPANLRTAVVFYSLVGVLIATAYLMLSRYVWHHPELLEKQIEPDYFRRAGKRGLTGLLGWSAAGILGYFTVPWLGLALLIPVPVFFALFSGGPTFETHPGSSDGSQPRQV